MFRRDASPSATIRPGLFDSQVGYANWVRGIRQTGGHVSATDKIKNKIDEAEGKAKEALGRVSGDRSTENEGRRDQAKSNLKDAGEKVKDAAKS